MVFSSLLGRGIPRVILGSLLSLGHTLYLFQLWQCLIMVQQKLPFTQRAEKVPQLMSFPDQIPLLEYADGQAVLKDLAHLEM